MGQVSFGFKFNRSFAAAALVALAFTIATLPMAQAGFSNFEPLANVRSRGCHNDFALIGGGSRVDVRVTEVPRPAPIVPLAKEKIPLKHKVLEIGRLLRATNVVELNGQIDDRLVHLPPGNYVYSIDTHNRLIFVPRALNPGPVNLMAEDATFIGSHEGIRVYMRAIYHVEPEFLAAGEFTVRDGRVLMVSNGAGTFRGSTEHLDYAMSELQAHGLAVDSRTARYDFSKKQYSEPHGMAPGQARAEIEASRDPGFASLQKMFRTVMKKVDEKFPGQTDFVRAAMDVRDREQQGLLLQAAGIAGSWATPQEGEAYVIRSTVQSLGRAAVGRGSVAEQQLAGEQRVRSLLNEIERFADSHPVPKNAAAATSRAP